MFEKNFIGAIMGLINIIVKRIGNFSNPAEGTIFRLLKTLSSTRVLRYVLWSYSFDIWYTSVPVSSTEYETLKTWTITVPSEVTAYTYIMFNVNFYLETDEMYTRWQVGFGENPSTWTTLGEYHGKTEYRPVFILDPSIYTTDNKIQLRVQAHKGTGNNTYIQLRNTAYCDVQYY